MYSNPLSSPINSTTFSFYNNSAIQINIQLLTSQLSQLQATSKNQQLELAALGKVRAENSSQKLKWQSLTQQNSSTLNSLAAARAENMRLRATLQDLALSRLQSQAVRGSLSAEAAALHNAATAVSVRSESLQSTAATQQQYLATDLRRRQEIARMLGERAGAAADVAALRSRRAWHLGDAAAAAAAADGGPVPVGGEILLLQDPAASAALAASLYPLAGSGPWPVDPPADALYATLPSAVGPAVYGEIRGPTFAAGAAGLSLGRYWEAPY